MRRAVLLLAVVFAVTLQPSAGLGAPVPELSPAQLPEAGLPDIGLEAPEVELPPVELPPVELPPVELPPPETPSVEAPSTPAPALPAPSVPAPSVGALGGGALPTGSGTATGATGAAGPSGAAGTGTEGPTVASRRARAAVRRRRGARDGLFGTRHATRRAIVRALDGCLDEISRRGATLLVLRYGVGPFDPRPAAEVARALGLSRAEYLRARDHALRGLVRNTRRSSCEDDARAGGSFAGGSGAAPFRTGAPSALTSTEAGAAGRAAVLGESASSPPEASDQRAAGVASPAVTAGEDGGLSVLPALLLALLLGSSLWFFGVKPARAAAQRRHAYRDYMSGDRKK